MATFIVKVPNDSGITLKNGVATCVVTAENATDARAICESVHGDGAANWTDSSVTASTVSQTTVGDAMAGWRMLIEIVDTDFEVEITAGVGEDLDQMATEAAAALVAAGIATAAYNATTNVLTVAGAAANLGDKTLSVKLFPPNGYAPVSGLISSITDEGVAGAALTVTFQADTYVLPAIQDSLGRSLA